MRSEQSFAEKLKRRQQQQRRADAARAFESTEEKLQAALEKVCEDVTTRARVSDGNDGVDEEGADAKGNKSK